MKCSKSFGILMGAMLALPLIMDPADAGQETVNITVQANVVAACTFVTPPSANIDFGDLTSGSPGVAGPFEPVVNCPQGLPFEWGFDGGQHTQGGQPVMLLTNGDPNDPLQVIPYNMVDSTPNGSPIGDTGGALISAGTNTAQVQTDVGTGADQTLSFFAETAPLQVQQVEGPYSDVITFLFAF